MSGNRGVAWRREEVLDLLTIWGDKKIQTALRESHRNRDVYEEISKGMLERGHARTADECRTKTKGMRQAYKKVLANNSKSGNSPTTCPYFEQLEEILRGDPSVKRRRISQSTSRGDSGSSAAQTSTVTLELRELSPEEEMDILNAELAINAATSAGSNTGHDVIRNDSVLFTPDPGNDIESILPNTSAENAAEAEDNSIIAPNSSPRDPDSIPPGAALSDLSPPSRIALREVLRKKATSINKVGEVIVKQSSKDNRAILAASVRENDRLIAVLQSTQEREDQCTQAVLTILKDTVGSIAEMTKSIAQSVQCQGDMVNNCITSQPLNRQQLFSEQCNAGRFSDLKPSCHDKRYPTISESEEEDSIPGSLYYDDQSHTHADFPKKNSQVSNAKEYKTNSIVNKIGHRRAVKDLPHSLSLRYTRAAVTPNEDRTADAILHNNSPVYSQSDNLAQVEDDSPDYMGTHVWGETQTEKIRNRTGIIREEVPSLSNLLEGCIKLHDPCGLPLGNCSCTVDNKKVGMLNHKIYYISDEETDSTFVSPLKSQTHKLSLSNVESPDYVGTHVWGESQVDHMRDKLTLRGDTSNGTKNQCVKSIPSSSRRELSFGKPEAQVSTVSAMQFLQSYESNSDEEPESESLLSFMKIDGVAGYSKNDVSGSSTQKSNNFELPNENVACLTPRKRKVKNVVRNTSVSKSKDPSPSKVRKMTINKSVKGTSVAESKKEFLTHQSSNKDSDCATLNVLTRSKRTCRAKVIFSPTI